jgi:hypothetical protein
LLRVELLRLVLDFLVVLRDFVLPPLDLLVLLAPDLRALLPLDFFAGTLPPARRASDSPIAIACLRLLTVFPERPLFNVPLLRSCIAFLTLLAAFFPYLAIWLSFTDSRPLRGRQ